MSEKNKDCRGRWRYLTIAFHVSPEENEEINKLVKLSGMTKQDYIVKRLRCMDVVVVGNPKVHKALRDQINELTKELQRITQVNEVDEDTLDVLLYTASILKDMRNETTNNNHNIKKTEE